MNVLIILSLILTLILVALGLRKILFSKDQTVEVLPKPRTTKVDFISISKTNEKTSDEFKDFDFDISTISFKENEIETLVTLQNNSSKHIRIEILDAYFMLNNQRFQGDFKLRELTMGTNDILLKNTILSQQTLIRNIYFTNIQPEEFSGTAELTIQLLINEQAHTLIKNINQSTIKQLQIYSESND